MPDDVSRDPTDQAAPAQPTHDHATCPTCNQIYRDGYRTGYMHAGGDLTKLPSQGE